MTLIQPAKLNGVDPMAWLTDVLERVVSGRTKAHELHTLLPWNWAAANADAILLPSTPRGFYDILAGLLSSVRVLSITPSAVSDLGATLGPLDQLRKLTLAPAGRAPEATVAAAELVELVGRSPLLKGVTVASGIAGGWSAEAFEDVRAAAVKRSICLSA